MYSIQVSTQVLADWSQLETVVETKEWEEVERKAKALVHAGYKIQISFK